MHPLMQVALASVIGLAAGVLGGLAGIGGSMVMLPGLALVFGYRDAARTDHHVYMAAAMVVNVLVAIPATRRHAKAGAIRRELVAGVMPFMIVAILAGVAVSNLMSGELLKRLLAAFIATYCIINLIRVAKRAPDVSERPSNLTRPALGLTGTLAGFVGGLLGLGGGVVMVPMLQLLARVKLREAIATSSAVMSVSAGIGAGLKLATLHSSHGRSIGEALLFVAAMAPGAVLGGGLGARLAHALPIHIVRIAISVLLLIAAAKMANVDDWVRTAIMADHRPAAADTTPIPAR